MKTKAYLLDREERATIRAALRMFRDRYEDSDAAPIRKDWKDYFNNRTRPMGTEDIETLIDRLAQ